MIQPDRSNNSTPQECSVKHGWGWLPFGYTIDKNLEVPIDLAKLRSLCEQIVTNVLPQEIRISKEILDCRGKELPHFGPTFDTPKEELLFISGTRSIKTETGEEQEQVSFSYSIHTRFERFEGNRRVAYAVIFSSEGLDDFGLNLLELPLRNDLTVERFRFSIELFEPKFVSIFGYTPVVTSSMTLEASAEALLLNIHAEGLKSKGQQILGRYDLYKNLREIIAEVAGCDV